MKPSQLIAFMWSRRFRVAVLPLLAATLVGSALAGPTALSRAGAVALALSNDEQLAQAGLAVEGARADATAAGAGRLPRLDLSGSWNRNLQKTVLFLPPDMAAGFGGATKIEMGRDQDLQAALGLTLNLWTAGRLSAAAGAAAEAVESARWRKALTADVVRYTVEQAYADAQLAAAQVHIAEGALAASREAYRVTAAGFEQGTASRFDLLRTEVELSNREAPLIGARNAQALAELNLKRICGLDDGAELELTDSLGEVAAPEELDDLLARMRAGSHELHALDHLVAVRRQQISLAKAGRGPVVQLQGNLVLQGQWDDGLTPGKDERSTSSSVGLAVSLPLFDGFATRAAVDGAWVDLRTAELERERVARDRELGVRNARLNLSSAVAALAGRRDAVALAEEAHRLAIVRLENGLATPLERLDAELALTEARAQLASILHDCNIAAAALALAVGDGNAANAATEVER
jgi:outer membrane protein TolC